MPEGVTQLLARAADGDPSAVNRLMPSVYDQLRALAEDLLSRERPDHTLQATALVHEAYVKLVDQRAARLQDRAHFFAVAAQAMRRILVDHARTHKSIKRGAGRKVSLDTELLVALEQSVELISLDDALRQLASVNANAASVVELRYFGDLTIAEAALVLGVSDSTVEREWRYARAWLYRVLGGSESAAGDTSHVD
jgi:RNA polymerase sigma-70 factor, ECF subfamily